MTFKDVAHLYLGCECLCELPDLEVPQRLKIDCVVLLNADFFKNPKPILRPLSSMTDSEKDDFEYYSMELMIGGYNQVERNSFKTKWYLDKGFDLFGLIASGEAIDATTLK